jgi:hypothetical protein
MVELCPPVPTFSGMLEVATERQLIAIAAATKFASKDWHYTRQIH